MTVRGSETEMPGAVVLLSGGLDSYTAAAMARADGYRLFALTISYGQRHAQELAALLRAAFPTAILALHDVAVAHINALWEWIEAGTAPPAPSRWPVIDLVELIMTLRACSSPNAILMARVSALSL